jgi:hypothetical protein
MDARNQDVRQSKQAIPSDHQSPRDDAPCHTNQATPESKDRRLYRTARQNAAIDLKRNEEQQYHAAGVAHDPHNRTQELVDSGDPEAGDIDEETRYDNAPFNKTYGHRQ